MAGLEKLQRKFKIHKDLSELIFYCQSLSFKTFEEARLRGYQTMSSWGEKKAFAVISARGGQPVVCNVIATLFPLLILE